MVGARRMWRVALALLVVVALWPAGRAGAQLALGFEPVAAGLSSPIGLAHAGDGSGRLFIVEQTGRIKVHDGTRVLPTDFLDATTLIACCGERGLLGLAFHPNYPVNGFFYVNYTDLSGNTVVARYRVSGDPDVADAGSAQVLLTVAQPFANHNGGQLAFGPDGYLYIALGDGGSGGDPGNRAQNLGTLLGKILRIDVDSAVPYAIPLTNPFRNTPGALPEIWAYGLRNPWRFSFDRQTGDLFIGDVGQNTREEVNFQPVASSGGENYGWRRMEGSLCFDPSLACNDGTLTLPVLEYDHALGCSITGGYRYRGARFPQLAGRYFYGDFCSGLIWNGIQSGETWSSALVLDTGFLISSFGEDEAGEMYVVDRGGVLGTGTLQRIVETSQSFPLTVTRIGSGTGTVASVPAGIDCGTVCSRSFGAGAVVTLTPTPAVGSAFTGWAGGGCSGTGPCTVTVAAATNVSATFTTVMLTVVRAGTGSGTIISAPGGIGCPVTCVGAYAPGTAVTLTAQADLGSAFGGWSGGGCAGTGPCVVTLGADQTVTATFVFERFVLSVSRVGPGSVSSRPVGISCGATCIGAFAPGTTVTVTATAAAGATFSGWTGACAGTLGRCTVTMNAARSVTATFTSTASGVFSDDPLAALVGPIIKAVHVTDLRLAIDRERTRRLLSPFGWTDPVLVPGVTAVRAAHLLQMRTALAEAYQAAGRTPPTYSDAAVIARQTAIRAAHIEELRDAVLALR